MIEKEQLPLHLDYIATSNSVICIQDFSFSAYGGTIGYITPQPEYMLLQLDNKPSLFRRLAYSLLNIKWELKRS
jgi:hypothetical protein